MNKAYLFKSARLGFRNWKDSDILPLSLMNSDPQVMEFFPNIITRDETEQFIERMQNKFMEKGFCYFAVDRLDSEEFIGFIGLSEPTFESGFTPCIDMGWRLASKEWYKGFATEGALQCLEYAFNTLQLNTIVAICPIINGRSEAVMKKIGMQKERIFDHPLLENNERLRRCFLYQIEQKNRTITK